MNFGLIDILLLLVTGCASFFIGRKLSARWRARRRAQDAAKRLAGQSRQVRRAEERRRKRRG